MGGGRREEGRKINLGRLYGARCAVQPRHTASQPAPAAPALRQQKPRCDGLITGSQILERGEAAELRRHGAAQVVAIQPQARQGCQRPELWRHGASQVVVLKVEAPHGGEFSELQWHGAAQSALVN